MEMKPTKDSPTLPQACQEMLTDQQGELASILEVYAQRVYATGYNDGKAYAYQRAESIKLETLNEMGRGAYKVQIGLTPKQVMDLVALINAEMTRTGGSLPSILHVDHPAVVTYLPRPAENLDAATIAPPGVTSDGPRTRENSYDHTLETDDSVAKSLMCHCGHSTGWHLDDGKGECVSHKCICLAFARPAFPKDPTIPGPAGDAKPKRLRNRKPFRLDRPGAHKALCAWEAKEARHRFKEGDTLDAIANAAGVHLRTIVDALRGDTWAGAGGPIVKNLVAQGNSKRGGNAIRPNIQTARPEPAEDHI
jgi:hypothetical protein